jgi:hypothetical protein
MKPEGSLPCLEEPVTGPFSELHSSNLHLPTLFPEGPFSHLRLGLVYKERKIIIILRPKVKVKLFMRFPLTENHDMKAY